MAVMVITGHITTALPAGSRFSRRNHMATNNSGYYVLYRDNLNQWRWTFHAANNRVIAVASEGYINKADCVHSINLIAGSAGCAIIER